LLRTRVWYRKQERSLFTAALEQTPPAMSAGCVRRRACGLPYPASGQRLRPPVAFPACVSTRAPGRCPPFHTSIRPRRQPIVQQRPGVGREGEAIPRPVVRGPIGHCASLVALPPYPPPAVLRRFGRATASYVDHPQVAMGPGHRPGTASGTDQ